MSHLSRTLAVALEAVAIVVLVIGIAIEVDTRADIGHFIISAGSLTGMLGAMIFAKFVKWKR